MELSFSFVAYNKKTDRLTVEYNVLAEEGVLREAFPIITQEQKDVLAPWVPEWPDTETDECFLEVRRA